MLGRDVDLAVGAEIPQRTLRNISRNPNFGGAQLTAGSNSVRGMWKLMREAGASARDGGPAFQETKCRRFHWGWCA